MGSSSLARGRTRVAGFQDAEMDYQLMRQLGSCRYGGASVGECLYLAARIQDADPDSWVQEFALAAARQQADAEQRAHNGHLISARDQYLLACNSYRAAEYYSDISAPTHRQYGLASRKCFLQAMQCAQITCDTWEFELNGVRLPAYHLYRPGQPSQRVLAIVSGYDGTLEESWLVYGAAAFERGFEVVVFSGPGQMDSWRFNQTSIFRPDFELIGHKIIDNILGLPDKNAADIALMGISFGGYFATRIAAHEQRLGALIANSPITDLHAYMCSFAGFDPSKLSAADNFGMAELSSIPSDVMDAQKKAMAANLMLRFGQASFRDTYLYLQEFKVTAQDLHAIQCPCLALVGAGEGAVPLQQSKYFLEHVAGAAQEHIFSAQEGADGHCQSGNPAFSAAVSMDWLEDIYRLRT